jgi:hypothetical protein
MSPTNVSTVAMTKILTFKLSAPLIHYATAMHLKVHAILPKLHLLKK